MPYSFWPCRRPEGWWLECKSHVVIRAQMLICCVFNQMLNDEQRYHDWNSIKQDAQQATDGGLHEPPRFFGCGFA
jgi:hypothetical protein